MVPTNLERIATELLFLYDWRFELAQRQNLAITNQHEVHRRLEKELEKDLREYGERKKKAWAELREELKLRGC